MSLRENIKKKEGKYRSMDSVNYSRCFLNMLSHRGSIDMKWQQKQAKILQAQTDVL